MLGNRSGRRAAGMLALFAALLVAQAASAATVVINDTDLTGGGPTTWDASNNSGGCVAGHGYSPVEDGKYGAGGGALSDAFDGGLMVKLNGKRFKDPDGNGDLVGQSLSVGPQKSGPFRVMRKDTALATTPTLRSLVRLQNLTDRSQSAVFNWDSDLGSDGDEAVRASSSGDLSLTRKDRWVVTSDDPTTPNDPPLTFVLFGKGNAQVKPAEIVSDVGTGCMVIKYAFTVPAGVTRYLMFFTEMNDSNGSASMGATKFNDVKAGGALMDGVKKAVRGKILNWAFG